jgi:hypothetical protein
MRLFRPFILFACLLLAGSSLIAHQHAKDRRPAQMVVMTVEGCRVWMDHVPADGRVTWTGGCGFRGHFADGVGRLDVNDRQGFMTERYQGEMRNGLKHGPGSEHKNRDIYGGDFWLGKRTGFGSELIGGVRYEGKFQDGERSGRGTMTWLNRDVYVGSWRNGLPHGYGEVIIGTERIAGQWYAGCLLNSQRAAAVATPLDRCLGLTATYTDDAIKEAREPRDDDVFGYVTEFEGGGCVPVYPGSIFRLCN